MLKRLVACVVTVAMGGGCTLHVRPPVDVVDPVTVYVVDYGDTGRLWLPVLDAPAPVHATAPPAYTEWCYGDWTWYAKDEQSVLYGAVVLVVPTQGALGRRQWREEPAEATADMPNVEIHAIEVERERAMALSNSLSARHASQMNSQHFNPSRGIWFVHDDADYWLGHQSTSQTGDWLEALGCDVSGFAVVADYSIH